jgi:hypothetical protein
MHLCKQLKVTKTHLVVNPAFISIIAEGESLRDMIVASTKYVIDAEWC